MDKKPETEVRILGQLYVTHDRLREYGDVSLSIGLIIGMSAGVCLGVFIGRFS